MQITLPPGTIILAGPTASGKSAVAVELAQQIGGEIVGADAFQVYRGLDILSAKPEDALVRSVPHHLIGEVPLTESFDVAKYLERAARYLAEIQARGRVVIICGGTGLYLRSLTHGLADLPAMDAKLREELSAKSLDELGEQLRALDPECAATMNFKNPRRVIRALEVCLLSGKPFSSFRSEWRKDGSQVHAFVLTRPREKLYERIDARCLEMFRRGVVDEVAAISEIGRTAGQMLGLHEIREMLAGEISREECIAAIQQSTRNYAKRQLTWLRREKNYEWIDLETTANAIDQMREKVRSATVESP